MILFFLAAGIIFSAALLAGGYYVWSAPDQAERQLLGARLRELRANMPSQARQSALIRQEHRSSLAFLGDLVTWVGVLRRLQEIIKQANLKYRAADVFGLSLALALASFLMLGVGGLRLLLLRLLIAGLIGAAPVLYILRVRSRRLKKFEEQLPDAIDLFTR